jgi:glycine/D-amino acid oxidase-like deaminating enzyme
MPATTLIVGQGLAGTLLGWELERAGLPFEIADAGHELAASRIAAGIINPITGQRFVKSWRLEDYLPIAQETYLAFQRDCGARIWRDMRVRRLFRSNHEGRVASEKRVRGEFGPYVTQIDHEGFWIEGAAHVDTAELISVARKRWLEEGRLRAERVEVQDVVGRYDRVIDCRGVATTFESNPANTPWEFSKGESLVISIAGLAEDEILNRGNWVLPLGGAQARVGSTHEPGRRDRECTAEGRAVLERAAAELTNRKFSTVAHEAGVRVYLPDRRPVMGWISPEQRLGVFNGLGAKGALYGPAMARAWAAHLTRGEPIDAELDVKRFG